MPILTALAFFFLGTSLLSLWFSKDPKIWGSLLVLSLGCGGIAGHILLPGAIFIVLLLLLWIAYVEKPMFGLFSAIVFLSMCFKLHLLPGYQPWFITSKFAIGLENPLIGLFPLAFLVPLAVTASDWKEVIRGLAYGCAGIALLAIIAIFSGVVHWQFKLPAFMTARMLSNLILTSIPEEGFYRGFVQKTLGDYLSKWKFGKAVALVLASLLFAGAHFYWSPNIGMLAFTFLAGFLYGGVYLLSGKIESAILCHFLLNLIHMTFFSYHGL